MRIPTLPGVAFALTASLLFGVSTPFSKILLEQIHPVFLAGLLYLGSGIGLGIWWLKTRIIPSGNQETPLKQKDLPWLAGAVLSGGVIAPVLLLLGLSVTPASTTALLLNLEGVMTALLAWFLFKEHFSSRIVWGMAVITGGGIFISWSGLPGMGSFLGPILVASACLAWGLDNNLTQKISASDPIQIACIKGLSAGSTNLIISLFFMISFPTFNTVLFAGLVGFLGFGISVALFVYALRLIGTARTSAYFSTSPFVGALLSILILGESWTVPFLLVALLMGLGVWLHISESHDHEHFHLDLEHDHWHSHDVHHNHDHEKDQVLEEDHSHSHNHEKTVHSHPHFPDIHHRHPHP